MKLVSLTIARNSAWCINATLKHALRYVDEAVVLDHASTDGTTGILKRMSGPLHVLRVDDPEWNEMHHRQATLNYGRKIGGTHFVIIDDDEILTQHLVKDIREVLCDLPPGVCLKAPLMALWRSLDYYRSDFNNPFARAYKSVGFADAPDLFWESKDGYQHHHTHPYNSTDIRWLHHGDGGYLHFQHANWRRLVIKQTWYMCMELLRYGKVVANYKGTMDESGLELKPVPSKWWGPEKAAIKLDAEPWQLDDIKRMASEHGTNYFEARGVNVRRLLKENQ